MATTIQNLMELPLGQDGIGYVRHALECGTSLSKQILKDVFSGGAAFAVVPEGTSLARAKQFEIGDFSRGAALIWLSNRIKSLCLADPGGTFVVEDPWGGRYGESGVMRGNEKKFFHDPFVYYFTEGADPNDKSLEETIKAPGYLFIGAFSRYTVTSAKLPPDLKVDDQLISDLAKNVEQIFISAYDLDGFVVWRK